MPTPPPGIDGTFFWKGSWSILDYFVLTPELEKGFSGAEVLTELEGHSLLTGRKQVPRSGELASDHLPVLCKIHYQ